MKTLTALLLALTLFSCSKEKELQKNASSREITKVTVNTFGWMKNYRLKYKRASGYVDTVINQANYNVQYNCFTNELNLLVSLSTIERYDKDTLKLKVTVNNTITQQAIINKCDAECTLQPNQAL